MNLSAAAGAECARSKICCTCRIEIEVYVVLLASGRFGVCMGLALKFNCTRENLIDVKVRGWYLSEIKYQ